MLEVGKNCKTGQTVSEILGQSNRACCYFTEDDHIRWEYFENNEQVPANMMPAINKFDALLKQISSSIPHKLKKHYFEHAAKSLFSALHVNEPEKINEAFSDIEGSISEIRVAPVVYTIAGVVVATILVILLLILKYFISTENNNIYFIAPLFGVMGSLLSIIQRAGNLWSDPSTGRMVVIALGAIRPVTGAILGLFALLLINGKFILGSTENTFEVIIAVSFLFGLSERVIPEITKSLERKVLN